MVIWLPPTVQRLGCWEALNFSLDVSVNSCVIPFGPAMNCYLVQGVTHLRIQASGIESGPSLGECSINLSCHCIVVFQRWEIRTIQNVRQYVKSGSGPGCTAENSEVPVCHLKAAALFTPRSLAAYGGKMRLALSFKKFMWLCT